MHLRETTNLPAFLAPIATPNLTASSRLRLSSLNIGALQICQLENQLTSCRQPRYQQDGNGHLNTRPQSRQQNGAFARTAPTELRV
jgi:hypothetical protein